MSAARSGERPRVAVVQDGARLHYALPLALQRRGLLERVLTSWYTAPASVEAAVAHALAYAAPALAQRVADRYHPELDVRRVHSSRSLILRQRLTRRRFPTLEAYYRHCARLEARWVLRAGWGRANALAGFVRNLDPLLGRAARQAGLRVVADQMIAPAAVERREVALQHSRWPGWEPASDIGSFEEFEQQTWATADRLTCASEYVRDGLVAQGVEPGRVRVIPYPVAADAFRFVDRSGRPGPVTVGFLGQVGLRKGAPYFFEVARRLAGRARFVMVGPVGLLPGVAARHAGAVELVGPVPRSEVPAWLARFDVFLFPSTCEGSASAAAEAMLTGLPVVTTPNSGTVVRDGVDGFVAAYDDLDRLTEGVGRLTGDAALRHAMGHSARDRAAAFDLDTYAARLAELFDEVFRGPPTSAAAPGSPPRAPPAEHADRS
jgi:glycosyltransferase involved in cell wall biosynthesis